MAARFREEQQFRQLWVWALTLLLAAGATAYAAGTLFEKFILGAFQHKPTSVTVQMFVSLAATGVLWALTALMYAARLVVQVDEYSVVVQFFPFTREHRYHLSDVAECVILEYQPFADHGGWGVKVLEEGRVYTASGTRGVSLQMASGETILIGSQRTAALHQAITTRPEDDDDDG